MNAMTQTPYSALIDDDRRKRLYFRAWHRGTREMDLLMGGYADEHLAHLSLEQLDIFEQLLEIADQDLYGWLIGRIEVPLEYQTPIYTALKNFHSRTKVTKSE